MTWERKDCPLLEEGQPAQGVQCLLVDLSSRVAGPALDGGRAWQHLLPCPENASAADSYSAPHVACPPRTQCHPPAGPHEVPVPPSVSRWVSVCLQHLILRCPPPAPVPSLIFASSDDSSCKRHRASHKTSMLNTQHISFIRALDGIGQGDSPMGG